MSCETLDVFAENIHVEKKIKVCVNYFAFLKFYISFTCAPDNAPYLCKFINLWPLSEIWKFQLIFNTFDEN